MRAKSRIRIDTQKVRKAGRRLLVWGDRLVEIGYRLQSALVSLDVGVWEGISRAQLDEMLGRVRLQGTQVAQGLRALGRLLLCVADVFEEQDDTAARNLAGIPWVDWDDDGDAVVVDDRRSPPGLIPPPPPPNTDDFDEKVEPPGVQFEPRADVPSDLANVRGSEGVDSFVQGLVHPNSCGVVALTVVLRTAYPTLTAQDVWDRAVEDLPQVDPNMTTAKELRSIVQHYKGFVGDVRAEGSVDAQTLRSAIREGSYPVALVEIDGGDNRLLTADEAKGVHTVSHWVVVTGMSDAGQWSAGKRWQWVQVYNPYDDDLEYYTWEHFQSSLSAANDYKWLVARYEPPRP
ncbi:MAG: hypothetical protein PVH62_08710 [Anaerolineae bacterium]|jgi:hypothetical protein